MFVVRGSFYPETIKEQRRLVKRLRELDVKVDEFHDKVEVRYLGDDLTIIAIVIETVEVFKTHEITLHEL